MKTIRDLIAACQQGKTFIVTFRPEIENLEDYPETGMRAVITSAREHHSDMARVYFDFAPFDDYNKPLEKANWYDKDGQPSLTAREKGKYKPQEDFAFGLDEDLDGYFEFANDSNVALFNRYLAEKPPVAYVTWLENLVNSLQSR